MSANDGRSKISRSEICQFLGESFLNLNRGKSHVLGLPIHQKYAFMINYMSSEHVFISSAILLKSKINSAAIYPDCMIFQSKWRFVIETDLFTLVFKRTFLYLDRTNFNFV